jgi:prepilin peptidase CpaA
MVGALAVAVIGAVTDVAGRRIPNRLTYPAMLAGIAGHSVYEGWHGLWSALAGGLIGGGLFLIFFLLHAMGAGDVKLITAVGCLAGSTHALQIVLFSAMAGGVLALVIALWKRRLRSVLGNVLELVRFHAAEGGKVHPTLNLSNPQAIRLPYGVAIAMGVLSSVLAFYSRGGL